MIRRKRMMEDLDRDIREHIEMETQDNIERGMTPEEARYAATRKFGNVTRVKEEVRQVWSFVWLEQLWQDFRCGLRNLRNKPLANVMVVAMLCLGVAGNAAAFSVFDSLFLQPLPFRQSNQLIDLDETAPKWSLQRVGVSDPDLFAWRERNSTFDSMAFFRTTSYNFSDGLTTQRVQGAQVTRELLTVLGLQPFLGRNFSIEDDTPNGAKVVMLTYDFWQKMFLNDRNVLGRVVKLDEEPHVVIGVLPREASFPGRVRLWIPLAANPNSNSGYYVNGVGRLKPGVSIEQAEADLLQVHKGMVAQGHRVNEITSPVLTPLRERYLGDFRVVSQALLGAVGLVLLIACVNIGALMLVQGSSRYREMAIRTAFGASQRRIVAQLATESLAIVVIGGSLGALVGGAGLRLMAPILEDKLPQWISFSLDWRFVLFCITIAGAAALLFGVVPALQSSRVDVRGSLQDSGARMTPHRGQRVTLSAFVVCEIGLALMLSAAAIFLLQAMQKVLTVDPGFRPENVVTFRVAPPDNTYGTPAQKIVYFDELLARLRALPGVTAAGATSAPPLGGQWGGIFEAEGARDVRAQSENPTVLQVAVTPGYLEAIGMRLLNGRRFEQQDGEPEPRTVAIVNETCVKHYWPNANPLGKRIRRLGGTEWYEVIGVTKDEKHFGLDKEAKPSVFLPYPTAMRTALRGDERSFEEMTIVLRSSADPRLLVNPAREIVSQVHVDVPVYDVQTMTEGLNRSLWVRRVYSRLFGAFAFIAMLLSAAGIYGTVSYRLSQRVREIGIRLALGAAPARVLGRVLADGMQLVSCGVALGLVGALWSTNFLRSLLFDVNSRDPIVYVAVALAVVGVALLANLVPARRAVRVDPMVALRYE
jgi:putative ABC transport system permease protein